MKINHTNYFKDGVLVQTDFMQTVFTFSNVNISETFALDEKGMKILTKFKNPKIVLDGNIVEASENGITAKIKTAVSLWSETDLTQIKEVANSHKAKCKLGTLKKAIEFVSKNTNKAILQGVNISKNYVIATNTFMLFREKNIIQDENEDDFNVTLSSEFIAALEGDNEEVIEIEFNANKAKCVIGETTYIGRLLSGDYPKTEKLFTYPIIDTLLITPEDVKDLLKYTSDEKNDIIAFNNDLIEIEGNISVVKQNDTKIEIEKGARVSCEYLKTAISVIEDEDLESGFFIKIGFSQNFVFINNNILIMQIVKQGE